MARLPEGPYKIGDRVVLANVRANYLIGATGTVERVIKTKRTVRVKLDEPRQDPRFGFSSMTATYDALWENVDPVTKNPDVQSEFSSRPPVNMGSMELQGGKLVQVSSRSVPYSEIMACPHCRLDPPHYIPRHRTEDD